MNTTSYLSLITASLFICSLALFGCQTPGATQQSANDEVKLRAMASEKYGADFELHYNEEKTAVAACKASKRHEQDPLSELQVSIYATSDLSVQAEEIISNCSKYFWRGDAFVVIEVPGIISSGKNQKPKERILYRTN